MNYSNSYSTYPLHDFNTFLTTSTCKSSSLFIINEWWWNLLEINCCKTNKTTSPFDQMRFCSACRRIRIRILKCHSRVLIFSMFHRIRYSTSIIDCSDFTKIDRNSYYAKPLRGFVLKKAATRLFWKFFSDPDSGFLHRLPSPSPWKMSENWIFIRWTQRSAMCSRLRRWQLPALVARHRWCTWRIRQTRG